MTITAELNRSNINQVISERLKIDANGMLNITKKGMKIRPQPVDANIGVFYLETWDENGVRRFYDQRFEAIAQMVVIDEGTRLDINLNTLNSEDLGRRRTTNQLKSFLFGNIWLLRVITNPR